MDIVRLTRSDKSKAVDVLAAAFWDYPVMRYILKDSGEQYENHLRALVGFFCETRLTRDWPLLGIQAGDEIAAIAGIDEPIPKPWPEELHEVFQQLGDIIGSKAMDRMELYETESAKQAPQTPHYFLGIIAVHPNYQKQGLARRLIERLAAMSKSHADSTGICLNTEDSGNVRFYKHVGFEIIDEADIGDIHTWCMFRPDK